MIFRDIYDRIWSAASAFTRCSFAILLVSLLAFVSSAQSQIRRSERSYISGGVMQSSTPKADADTTAMSSVVDSLATQQIVADVAEAEAEEKNEGEKNEDDKESTAQADLDAPIPADSLAAAESQRSSALLGTAQSSDYVAPEQTVRQPFISDSMSLSRVCWTSTLLPGFGQAYNKQYWKMPILYSTLALGTTLFVKENKKYKPLKASYDEMTLTNMYRTDELNTLQGQMIRSNTRRQLYLGATIASYIYFLGDAAINYSTNDVSDVKRATTLATIFPGAGQIYNRQYWKVPFVVGGFAALIYVIDWNNRGYQRFSKAYLLLLDYDNNPESYPDGPLDEFSGRYSTSYMKSLRDSYRRNRDLSIIMTAGLYILQIIDAHVDAHFKDFDISDDLNLKIEPAIGYTYSPASQSDSATYGFNMGITF
ncbi:MAG: DUF5683 domain-containing protein [Rikenellaceae bacterium]